jgi:hypothetical protein
MWHRRYGGFGFRFGFAPFGFWFHGMRPFPRRDEYLEMLEEYKKDLERELKEVEKEIEDLKKG